MTSITNNACSTVAVLIFLLAACRCQELSPKFQRQEFDAVEGNVTAKRCDSLGERIESVKGENHRLSCQCRGDFESEDEEFVLDCAVDEKYCVNESGTECADYHLRAFLLNGLPEKTSVSLGEEGSISVETTFCPEDTSQGTDSEKKLCDCSIFLDGEECLSCEICSSNGFLYDCSNVPSKSSSLVTRGTILSDGVCQTYGGLKELYALITFEDSSTGWPLGDYPEMLDNSTNVETQPKGEDVDGNQGNATGGIISTKADPEPLSKGNNSSASFNESDNRTSDTITGVSDASRQSHATRVYQMDAIIKTLVVVGLVPAVVAIAVLLWRMRAWRQRHKYYVGAPNEFIVGDDDDML